MTATKCRPEELRVHPVWDAPVRWFHWINVLCVLVLVALGLVILNASNLGIDSPGKITLKTVHVYTGYLFAANLGWRLVWAFGGNRHARWRAILPGGRGYLEALRTYVRAFLKGHPPAYLGHNPLGRIAVLLLLVLLLIQALTGLVLAGTDLFMPPFGSWIAGWIAAEGVEPASLMPYAKETYDATAYAAMRDLRAPVITLHLYTFYGLLVMIVLHVTAVVITELRAGGSLISAMFTGRKILRGQPVDND